MADLKITGLDALAEASIQATDALAIADLSATETKKVTVKDLIAAGVALIDSGDIPAIKVATPFAANSVATATIQDDAVTAAKLATDSVTADAVAANAIGASELADNAVDSGALATNSVITSKITDANVTADKLANNAVTTVKILDANVTYAKLNISDGDIPGAKITGNSITNAQIGADAVGSSELANNAVDTAAIADSAVTNAKLVNASISLGGVSISLGATDATPALNLTDATNYPTASLSGTISNAQLTGNITGDKLANTTVTYAKLNISDGDIAGAKITGNSITAAQIAANAVTASELADNAVDTTAVVDAAITSAKIASNTIVAGNLAANSVGASELADNAVDTAAVANGAITTDKIADGAITTAKLDGTIAASSIADNSVTNAKIAANAVGASELADNAVDTAAIAASAITDAKVASGISGTKLGDGTITAAKLNTSNIDRSLNVASGNLGINNTITAATRSGITYNAQGLITATAVLAAADLPLATSSAVGGVSAGTGLSVNGSGVLALSNSVTGATVSGITFNNQGQITAATALTAANLPIATTSAKGAVQITSGGGLSVDGSGNLTTATSGISAGTYQSITVNNKGVATAGAALTEGLIPSLPASKITSGTLDAARIAADSIDSSKLSNSSTTIIQSIAQLGYPTAAFTGQLLFDPIAEDAYLWDGNAWNPITTLTKGALVRLGTYNANLSQVDFVTAAGSAAGLTVGQNLPVASESVDGGYVVISVQGTPSGIAGITGQLAPPDYLLGVTASATSSSWVEIDLSTTVASQQASAISYTPYGQLSATNVQAVINEIEDEKLSLAGGTVTGQILIGNAGSLVFEGATADAFETTLQVQDPTTSDKVLTLPNITGTLITTGDTGTVTGTMLANDTIQNVDIKSDAAIAFTKLADLTSTQILVGNGSNKATAVAVTGDISINNAGLTAIASGVIVNADISGSAAIAGSKVTTGTTSAVGVLQLTDSTSSTSATTAATPNAVKSAFDLATTANSTASAALPKAGGTMTGNLILDNAKEVRFSEGDGDGSNYTGIKAQAQSSDIVLTLPATAPTTGQVLKAGSTATTLEWAADSSTDSTKLPLAGGTLTGNLILNAQSDVRFADADSSNYVALQSPATVGTSFTLTLPAADGSSGQALISDGSGNLSFSTVTTAAAGSNTQVQFNNSGSFAGSSSLTFNSGTGALTATSFVGNVTGNLTGNVTGNTSGSAGSCTGNAGTATALASSVNIGGVAFDGASSISLPGVNASGTQDTSGTAALATQLTVTANNSTNETVYPLFADGATGSQGAETDTALTYNPDTGRLTAGSFGGAFIGNASTATALYQARNIGGVAFDGSAAIDLPGVNTAGNQDTTGTAALATQFTVSANNSTNETVYPIFVDGATGSQGGETDTGLSYNPSTGLLTSTGFSGAGTSLTALNASNLSSGTVNVARLGSGASNSKFLRGDNTWQTVTGTTINNNANNRIITGSGTANTLEGEATLTYNGSGITIDGFDSDKIILEGSSNPAIDFREGSTGKGNIKWSSSGYMEIWNREDNSKLRIKDDLAFSDDGSTFYSILNSNSTLSSSKLSGALPAISGANLTSVNATTLDSIDSGSFVRSDASDSLSGATYNFDGSTALKMIFSGVNNPYIRFQEGTTDKAWIGWDPNGYLTLNNTEDGATLRLKDDLTLSWDGSTHYTILHAGNVGSGQALSSKNVYVNQIHGDGSNLTNLPASGGTITATASGSISDEDACYIKSDGNIAAIASTAAAGTVNNLTQASDEFFDLTYDTEQNKYVIWYKRSSFKARVGTTSGTGSSTTTSWESEHSVYGASTNKGNVWYDPNSKRHLIVWQYSTHSIPQIQMNKVNSNGSMSNGSHGNFGSTSFHDGFCIVSGSNSSKCILITEQSSGGPLRAYSLAIDTDNETLTHNSGWGLYQIENGNTWFPMGRTYDSTNNRAIVSYTKADSPNNTIQIISLETVTATAPNGGTKCQLFSGNCGYHDVCWNPDTQRLVAVFGDDGASGATHYTILKYTEGQTANLEICQAATRIVADGIEAQNSSSDYLTYDEATKQVYVIYRYTSGGSNKVCWRRINTTAGSDAGTLDSENVINTSVTHGNYHLVFNASNNQQIAAFRDDGSTLETFQLSHESTNYSGDDFIGFAEGSYTNGQTATIKVTGSTTTKSSLTPGKKYYVQLDGSVGLIERDPSMVAGVALSSTSLLIRGY